MTSEELRNRVAAALRSSSVLGVLTRAELERAIAEVVFALAQRDERKDERQ